MKHGFASKGLQSSRIFDVHQRGLRVQLVRIHLFPLLNIQNSDIAWSPFTVKHYS